MRSTFPLLAILAVALTGCGNAASTAASDTADTPAPTASRTIEPPTASPSVSESTGFTPSGSFAADVTALGITPDNMANYEANMAESMCDSDLEPHVAGGSELAMNVRMMGDTDPDSGRHPNMLRAAVTYNCPSRADILEDAIQTAEDGGFIG